MDIFAFVCTVCLLYQLASVRAITVNTPSGSITGSSVTVQVDNQPQTVHTYLGIPYAKAPVGDLRFQKPQALDTAYDGFPAVGLGARCPQTGALNLGGNEIPESEDCLYLNIFVPERVADSISGHAVMFWIHGGGFIMGSGGDYNGTYLAANGNVIVVTMNYRLGPFGFLSTMDDIMPANLGLWDQKFAMEWVQKNIGSFGGDTARITIFGESAGSISCSLQALYPENRGLFQRIITQSGTANMWALHLDSNLSTGTKTLALEMGCETTNSYTIAECLRTKTWEEIKTKVNDRVFSPGNGEAVLLHPVVDGEFLRNDARKFASLMKTRPLEEVVFYQSLDILTGFNAYEGGIQFSFYPDPAGFENFSVTEEQMREDVIPSWTQELFHSSYPEAVYKLIMAEYTNWTNPMDIHSLRLQFIKFYSDTYFMVPAMEMAHIHQTDNTAGKTYLYHFLPRPTTTILPTPSWIPGANHGDEIQFVFGFPTLQEQWEHDLAKRMVAFWSSFAKTGNPNSQTISPPTWPQWTPDTQFYMEFDKVMNDNSVKQYVKARETNFWLHVFPGITAVTDMESPWYECRGVDSANFQAGNILTLLGVLLLTTLL